MMTLTRFNVAGRQDKKKAPRRQDQSVRDRLYIN